MGWIFNGWNRFPKSAVAIRCWISREKHPLKLWKKPCRWKRGRSSVFWIYIIDCCQIARELLFPAPKPRDFPMRFFRKWFGCPNSRGNSWFWIIAGKICSILCAFSRRLSNRIIRSLSPPFFRRNRPSRRAIWIIWLKKRCGKFIGNINPQRFSRAGVRKFYISIRGRFNRFSLRKLHRSIPLAAAMRLRRDWQLRGFAGGSFWLRFITDWRVRRRMRCFCGRELFDEY